MAPRHRRPSQTWRRRRSTVTSSDQLAATPSSPAASTGQPIGVSLVHAAKGDHCAMEQQMTSDQPAPVRAELALRHRDMDALGHVNQAVYHELLEEVRAAFFRHTLPYLPFTGYVLVHVELDYRREVRIEHRYLIGEGRVAELGRSRVEPDDRLLLPGGDVAVEGRARLLALG